MFVISVQAPDIDAVGPLASVEPALLPRSGTGAWPNGERAVRLGNAEEILITLPSNPFAAMKVAQLGEVFDPPISGFVVDVASRRDGDFEVSWSATLRAPIRRRKVSLRIYASPSLNVTVMTIVPHAARKISSRSFVRVGLRSARTLARRIEQGVPQLDGENVRRRLPAPSPTSESAASG